MYAVIRAGGKQYRVAPGDVIQIDRSLAADKDGNVEFSGGDVLAISSEAGKIGKPNGGGATVSAQVLDEGRADKVKVFKFKRKKQYKKLQGHRQARTTIRVLEIAYGGEKATAERVQRRVKKAADVVGAIAETAGSVAGAVAGVADVAKAVAKKAAPAKKSAAKKSSAKKAPAKKSTGKKK